jgi:hypothetical protein
MLVWRTVVCDAIMKDEPQEEAGKGKHGYCDNGEAENDI